jgi:hypothetical protein
MGMELRKNRFVLTLSSISIPSMNVINCSTLLEKVVIIDVEGINSAEYELDEDEPDDEPDDELDDRTPSSSLSCVRSYHWYEVYVRFIQNQLNSNNNFSQ